MDIKIPKYVQVRNKIVENIKSGLLSGKLPGERVLAQQYNVSYMTIRKAISSLTEDGILHKFTTKGTFVSNNKITPKATLNIGFFLDEEIEEGISSPYYSLVFNALEKEVKKHGYNLTLFSRIDDLNPLNNQKKIDGVIISCFPRLESKIQELKQLIPIILIDNISLDKSISSVTIDNFNSSREVTNHLIAAGHKRIGFISGLLNSDVCKDRLSGYTTAMQNSGFEPDSTLIYRGDYSYESGERGAEKLLSIKNPPTAIVCANDSMAIGAMKAIRESGFNIPEDIGVVGFDDIDVSSRVFPSLTTIKVPITKMAEESIKMLISLIKGNDLEYKHKILPAHLVIRNSCQKIDS